MGLKEIETHALNLDTCRQQVLDTQAEYADLIREFHKLWYSRPWTWGMTSYAGIATLKNPLDLWVVQEIIAGMKPDLIVETGTAFGGSALFCAHALDRVGGHGQVVSIDLDDEAVLPRHDRIRFVRGRSSTDPEVVAAVTELARLSRGVMVILDSDHRAAHVRAELDAYGPLVSRDHFLVVEDTNVNGNPIPWTAGDGPAEAVAGWLRSPGGARFHLDPLPERYLLTMYPGGWLRRGA